MLHLEPVPIMSDNYVWLLRRDQGAKVAVIDPGDGPAVRSALLSRRLLPVAILLTHHHADHVGGVAEVLDLANVPVWGPTSAQPVKEDDRVTLPALELELRVLEVPGHTLDHVAYVGPGFVACGDALFAGGCGRVFEGTMEQMFGSLERLARLPRDAAVCCGHEYTVANLEFAMRVDPDNSALARRLDDARALRRSGKPTVPSTIELERATNPFLRCHEPDLVDAASRRVGHQVEPGAATFAVIRRWKDGG